MGIYPHTNLAIGSIETLEITFYLPYPELAFTKNIPLFAGHLVRSCFGCAILSISNAAAKQNCNK